MHYFNPKQNKTKQPQQKQNTNNTNTTKTKTIHNKSKTNKKNKGIPKSSKILVLYRSVGPPELNRSQTAPFFMKPGGPEVFLDAESDF